MENPTDALDAVIDAAAVLTLARGELDPASGTIGCLTERLERLACAVARAHVVATVTPDAALDSTALPSFPPEDAAEHAADLATLRAIATLPAEPVTVRFHARPLGDGSLEDALRTWLHGQQLRAVPDGAMYGVDGNRLAADIAGRFFPPEA